ncbi:MAG: mechanosensitive ion channel family protein [Calothrix sp. CSU_2_0]|nr:mechanosensitive ion channel family protein [Calothrix sp. CSU_2_0]
MRQWAIPISFILLGIITGFFVEKALDKNLRKKAEVETETDIGVDGEEKTYLTGKEILLQSLNNVTLIWFILAGCFGAFITSTLEPNIFHSIRTILIVAFLFSLTIFVARLSSGFVTLFGQKTQSVSASIISNLTRITIFIFGILIILQTVGVKITPILTTLGVGGFAIALAVQDTLSNLFAGLYLIISQQFKTGDYVKLETSQEGYVIDINWRNTTIKDISNNIIIIPNSKLSAVIFTNYHLPVKEVVLRVDLGVGYASNLEYVEQITLDVAKEVTAEVAPELTTNEPFVRYHTFGESSIDLTVFMRVNEFSDRRLATHLFIKKLHQRYQIEKIEIPYPTRDIFIKHNVDNVLKIST